jgi:hypothetical protein
MDRAAKAAIARQMYRRHAGIRGSLRDGVAASLCGKSTMTGATAA